MAVLESADSHPQPRLLHSNILDGAVLRSDADIVGVHRLIKSRTYVCARGIYADGTQIRSHAPQEERRTERRLGHTHGKEKDGQDADWVTRTGKQSTHVVAAKLLCKTRQTVCFC